MISFMFPATARRTFPHAQAQPQPRPLPLAVLPSIFTHDYRSLVEEFEATAAELLGLVDDKLEEAFRDHEVVGHAEWRSETLFAAGQLRRFPWLLVNTECPPEYETLRLLYREWARACGDLASSLLFLARKDRSFSTDIRVAYADEELAAVTAHTAARTIYLASLRP